MSVNVKMTAIADEIRTLTGTTGKLGLDAMATNIGAANESVSDQSNIIAQIFAALDGKSLSNGSSNSGSNTSEGVIVSGDFAYAEEMSDEPGLRNYVLTSPDLTLSNLRLVIVFTRRTTAHNSAYKVLYRADLGGTFSAYNGSNDTMSHGISWIVNGNSIVISGASIIGSDFDKFWYIAI